MCKALTLQLRRCRHIPRDGNDYCGTHSLELPADGLDTNLHNLTQICTRIRTRYFNPNLELLTVFTTELPSEAVRQHVYEDMMPFLRDCWKMGITNENYSDMTLRTHYRAVGEESQVELPARRLTPLQRYEETHRTQEIIRRAARQHIVNVVHNFPEMAQEPELDRQQPRGGARPPWAMWPQPTQGLPSIAIDTQSVHRTSVNESVTAGIKILREMPWRKEVWPILHEDGQKFPGGRKLFEHIFLWSDIYTKNESKEMYHKLLPLIEKNYISGIVNINDTVHNTKPWIVLYKIIQWTFERPREEQKEIFKRLLEECYEGREMCLQGKVARFVNVLSGFHPDISVGLSGKELLQERMSRLALREDVESEAKMEEGRGILRDAAIPEAEWDAWLEPLLLF